MKPDAVVEREAAEWLVRQDRRESFDPLRFETWLAADSRHRSAWLSQESIWRTAERLKTFRPLDGSVDARVLRNLRKKERRPLSWWPVTVAATLTVFSMAFWELFRAPMATYSTDVGGFERALLTDGSVVLINTDSAVNVQLDPQSRDATLIRGEAYFKVTHDTRRPFQVHAGNTLVHADGSSFSMRIQQSGEVDVLVTMGQVILRQSDLQGASPTGWIVSAGELADIQSGHVRAHALTESEIARQQAWTHGELVFEHTPLKDAVVEFNRYSHRRVVLDDPSLASVRLDHTFLSTELDSFLRLLQSSFNIHAREVDGVIHLSGPHR